MLITGHTPNYSHTMVRTAGKGGGGRGLGFRYVSNKIQQKPSQNLLKQKLPNKEVAREIRETVKSKSMKIINPRIDY